MFVGFAFICALGFAKGEALLISIQKSAPSLKLRESERTPSGSPHFTRSPALTRAAALSLDGGASPKPERAGLKFALGAALGSLIQGLGLLHRVNLCKDPYH